jgi:hypothetical protein
MVGVALNDSAYDRDGRQKLRGFRGWQLRRGG